MTHPYPQDVTSPGHDQRHGLFAGPRLPRSIDPPADFYFFPQVDTEIARVHECLHQAADMVRNAHRQCHTMPCDAFKVILEQLAEADKILCEHGTIPHDPAQYVLSPVTEMLAGPST